MGRTRRDRLPPPVEVRIESLSSDGRGVAHVDGKALFVFGALPEERVAVRYTRRQRRHDEGVVERLLEAAPLRVEPACPHFGVCGGCALQHLDQAAQVATKQAALLDTLQRIGRVTPERVLRPLTGSSWGYRRKARLGAKWVTKKGRLLVGFRERGSSLLTDLEVCPVLHPVVGERLPELAALIAGLSVPDQVPQIEVNLGDRGAVLVFRVMAPLSAADEARLAAFGAAHEVAIYVQDGGPETVRPLDGIATRLSYALPEFGLELDFLPGDFTQVNHEINRQMVARAVELLAPEPHERVLDLFCGLGNFTLALARGGGEVAGVEGDPALVARARDNAAANRLANVRFYTADLYGELAGQGWLAGRYDKVLLDPPRSGALEVVRRLGTLAPRRILYVSCYPATLARDAEELVLRQGYRLVGAGVMDMFPHTGHVESMALFERDDN